jgi:hypothetical protein
VALLLACYSMLKERECEGAKEETQAAAFHLLPPPLCRRLPDEDPSVREVRISCPDATGLGVDLTRILLDFGLRILKGDISTDGAWCFLIFKVGLNSNVPPRWNLLKTRCVTKLPALCRARLACASLGSAQ